MAGVDRGTTGKPLRVAVFGCGFWAAYQIAGWREVPGVEVVALYNRTKAKAEALAKRFGIAGVYDSPEELLDREKIDVIDVITDVDTHSRFVHLATERRIPVICQKPMAPTLDEARKMVKACAGANVPYFIHENWRWQTPLRTLGQLLSTNVIGQPFRARIDFVTGFPVFDNQPFLRELPQFILTDIGSHVLDAARFLFGEATSLYGRTRRVHPNIKGEDVATVMMTMRDGMTVTCNMAYAENHVERDRFPETFAFVEGENGSIELGPDYWIRVTTSEGTLAKRYPPPRYEWVDSRYEVVQASIVPCNQNLADGLRGIAKAETTGEDNLKTVRLVFASYASAERNQVVDPRDFENRGDA